MANVTLIFRLLAVCSLFVSVISQAGSELTRLKNTLFTTNGYNTKVRPVNDQTHVSTVSVDFALVGINSFDDADQKLTTTGFLTVQWTDELLTWTPSDYDNIQSMLVPQNEVWKPDITLDNGLESKTSLGQTFIQVPMSLCFYRTDRFLINFHSSTFSLTFECDKPEKT